MKASDSIYSSGCYTVHVNSYIIHVCVTTEELSMVWKNNQTIEK